MGESEGCRSPEEPSARWGWSEAGPERHADGRSLLCDWHAGVIAIDGIVVQVIGIVMAYGGFVVAFAGHQTWDERPRSLCGCLLN